MSHEHGSNGHMGLMEPTMILSFIVSIYLFVLIEYLFFPYLSYLLLAYLGSFERYLV